MNQMWPFLLAALAVYSIFLGVRILLTGRLTEKEEAKLKDFSNKGARTYKLVYAVVSIVGGLLILAVAVIRFLENMKVIRFLENMKSIGDTFVLRLVFIGVALAIGLSMLFVRNACKKMKDDE